MFDYKQYTDATVLRTDLEQDFDQTHPEPTEPAQPVLTRPQVINARNMGGGEQPRLWVEVRNYDSTYHDAELVIGSTSGEKLTKLPPLELALLITELQRGAADLELALAYQANIKAYNQLKRQRREERSDYVTAVFREWRAWQQGTTPNTPSAEDFEEDYDEEDYEDDED